MVSTVSTTTVTTVTAIASMGLTAAISVAAVSILVLFLATREVAIAKGSGFSWRLGHFLSIGILPLLIAFVVIVVMKIAELVV